MRNYHSDHNVLTKAGIFVSMEDVMNGFGAQGYWEQEQLKQYERELHEEHLRQQEEMEYMQFCQHCYEIASGWLTGDLSEKDALEALMYAGEGNCEKSLLGWAEKVLEDETP